MNPIVALMLIYVLCSKNSINSIFDNCNICKNNKINNTAPHSNTNNINSTNKMNNRDILLNMLQFLNLNDENAMFKMQDMLDVMYRVTRMRDNSYSNGNMNNYGLAEKIKNFLNFLNDE